jgi:tetratricopeptide (TPR) repeat protein
VATGFGTGVESGEDPAAGRHTVWIVGAIGLAAIVGYGAYQVQQRDASTANIEVPTTAASGPRKFVPNDQVFEQVAAAQRSLDVAALAELEGTLAAAEARAMTPEETRAIRLVRAESITTRALEASIRAGTVASDKSAAGKVALEAIAEARAIVDGLPVQEVDPVRLLAVRVRLDLAEGDDVALEHPVVLLPGYHDAEIRVAALAQPLWTAAEVNSSELAELVVAMREATPPTALTRTLLGLALAWQGESEAATKEIDAVLAEVPQQPLAAGLRGRLTELALAQPSGDVIAEAEVEVEPDVKEEPEPTKVEPEPEPAKAEPEPEPAKAEPEPEPTKVEPEPDDPQPTEPVADPIDASTKKPKSKGEFDALLAEGCRLARGGDAQKGFAMLKKAHDMQPGGAKVTLCMAQAQARLGNVASARALADRVLRKAPQNKTALLFAAKLEADSGNAAGAKRLYQRVLDVDPQNGTAKAFVDSH